MTTTAAQPTSTTALVTGANKGLGRETVRALAALAGLGWTVWLGARDESLGTAAAHELSADGADVRYVALDVTDDASVAAAVATISAAGGLDVLVNNAGIVESAKPIEDVDPADFLPVYGVNVLGPVRMTRAFLPLLRQSAHPRIVNVSSGLGSFAATSDPDRIESQVTSLVDTSSKAALNMITTQYAKALTGVKVNVVDPGYTGTDLNGHRGTQTVEEGARAIIAAATLPLDGPTGTFTEGAGPAAW